MGATGALDHLTVEGEDRTTAGVPSKMLERRAGGILVLDDDGADGLLEGGFERQLAAVVYRDDVDKGADDSRLARQPLHAGPGVSLVEGELEGMGTGTEGTGGVAGLPRAALGGNDLLGSQPLGLLGSLQLGLKAVRLCGEARRSQPRRQSFIALSSSACRTRAASRSEERARSSRAAASSSRARSLSRRRSEASPRSPERAGSPGAAPARLSSARGLPRATSPRRLATRPRDRSAPAIQAPSSRPLRAPP